jgi:hypothetical protein
MQDCGIKVEHKKYIKQIKKDLVPASYAECGKCGAINANAKELARAIESITKDDDEGDCEEIYDILYSITEVVPVCFGKEEINMDLWKEWEKWESENAHRLCPFVEGYEGNVYIAYVNVILYTDEDCKCFKDKFE